MGKDVTNSKMKDVKETRKYQNDLKLIACNIKDHVENQIPIGIYIVQS